MGRSRSEPKHKRDASKIASKIAPRLYLTGLSTARDVTQLANLGITHVISIIEKAPIFPSTFPLRILHVPLSDCADVDILTHLPTTTSFIRDALAENRRNRVLVCTALGHIEVLHLITYKPPNRCIASWGSAGARLW
jgi:hypothetical protein